MRVRHIWDFLFACLVIAACSRAKESTPAWSVVSAKLDEALLSITGTATDDVWAVGADKGNGPLVVHYDGVDWSRIQTSHRGHLWWAHALSPDDVFMGGADGAILRWDGVSIRRMDTPGLGRDTVFGIWGSAPDRVYAVGGFAGRAGFIWRWNGSNWRVLEVPRNIPIAPSGDWPGFFKVWGDSRGRVWVVGGHGLVLRSDDGETFEVIESGVDATLFTVAGDDERVVVVGGAANCTVLEAQEAGELVDRTPEFIPLLQGAAVRGEHVWAVGMRGIVMRRERGGWVEVDHRLGLDVQSLHAVWIDPTGGVWSVGGNVLDVSLDKGVIIHRGAAVAGYAPVAASLDGGIDGGGATAVACPEEGVDPAGPEHSIARRWNELILDAIRRDIPRPGVHARNLYHTSVAMWDAWAAYDAIADGVFVHERLRAKDVDAARETAISFAAYRVLAHRYDATRAAMPGAAVSQACLRAFMSRLGLDPDDTTSTGETPTALGNRIGNRIVAMHSEDGANEEANYADTTSWMPKNPPLIVDEPRMALPFPSFWQQINIAEAATQNGIIVPSGVQGYIGANWGEVRAFALGNRRPDGLYLDPGRPPVFEDERMPSWVVDLVRLQGDLAVDPTRTIDLSPRRYGNNPLGTNDGVGYALNPATGTTYTPNVVPLGDFARVLAEHWADGPRSETPPGHWNTIANYVTDHPMHRRCFFGAADCLAGISPELDALEWDLKVYLAINGAMHDAAIVAWGVKRTFSGARPISLIRFMAQEGTLPLVPGLIERITAESAAVGARHAHLAPFIGQVAVLAWPGEPGNRKEDTSPIQWIRGVDWVPYQRRNFVTPGFPGYVSGHSTFSRAAAEVLAEVNGGPYFPGGLGEFVARAREYLVFEDGPSVDVRLQWATYFDAADQAGLSRLYGGIHLAIDDFSGRHLGSKVGRLAIARARNYFDGTAVP
jgi:hypothetical protein